VGAHYARIIHCSNNRKPEEPPQNERVNEALLRVEFCRTQDLIRSRPDWYGGPGIRH
jgi:hypothetical protein